MKIVHVYDGHERVFPGEGSTPSVVYYVAKYTAKKGYDVTVLERRWKDLPYEEEIEGIKFIRYDVNVCSNISNKELPHDAIRNPLKLSKFILDRFILALKANKYLKETDYDIIHFHLPFAANIIVNLNKRLREKAVYTAHIGEEKKRFGLDSSAPLLLRIFSPDLYLIKRVKKATVLNEPIRDKIVSKGIDKNKIDVIPNGIEIKDYTISKEKIYKIKEKYNLMESIVVMFAGSITPRKGVHCLVKAAERILKLGYNNVIFLCVGEITPDKEFAMRLINYVKKNNLEKNIKFTGFIPYDDLRALYSACDIFVLPSFEEGFGLVLTEALASGKPVIGTNVGGIPMQIIDGWNGFLVEPGNDKQLAEKIMYLMDNEEERERMGKNSKRLAEKFDWKNISRRYIEIYEEIARK